MLNLSGHCATTSLVIARWNDGKGHLTLRAALLLRLTEGVARDRLLDGVADLSHDVVAATGVVAWGLRATAAENNTTICCPEMTAPKSAAGDGRLQRQCVAGELRLVELLLTLLHLADARVDAAQTSVKERCVTR